MLAHLVDTPSVWTGRPAVGMPLPQTHISGFHGSSPPPSSSPAGCLRACFSTLAPPAGQRVRVGPSLCRERPLAGCRLSRETGLVGLPVRWPWSPSLSAGCAQMGPPFDGLPVLRDHPTPLVSSSSRRWFLDDYRASRGSREVSSGKHSELRTDAVAYTPACPTDMGFTAVGQLTPGPDASHSASLSLGSVLHRWTSTGRPLAGLAWCERPCLVDGGFPPSGPQEDLTTTCLTSLFCVHAEHTKDAARRWAVPPDGRHP
jgi:hypothetical protein